MGMLLLAASTVDLFAAIRDNDWLGFLCLIVLGVLSVMSGTVIFHKLRQLRLAKAQSQSFQAVVDEDGSWEELFIASKEHPQSPLARLLKEVYVECRMENWFAGKKALGLEARLEIAKASIENILLRTISREETRLNGQMVILATISTLAPFIGLFGTVWGVMAAFQAIGRDGGASIATLAPGISTALMTTIFGLVAAIPSLVAHNLLLREINKLCGSMESFSQEIENAVRKQIILDEEKQKAA